MNRRNAPREVGPRKSARRPARIAASAPARVPSPPAPPGFPLPAKRPSYRKKPPYLCLGLAGTLMSPAEYDAVEEWDRDYVYELINGVLVVFPSPSRGERGPNQYLGRILLNYQEDHPLGRALDDTMPEDTVIIEEDRRRADRTIWAGLGRIPDPLKDVPTICVEFVSRAKRDRNRDYVEKREEYLKLGVKEYWIIDRFRRVMTVWRARAGKRPQKSEVAEGGLYRTPLLPGFELPLAKLLKVADRYPGE